MIPPLSADVKRYIAKFDVAALVRYCGGGLGTTRDPQGAETAYWVEAAPGRRRSQARPQHRRQYRRGSQGACRFLSDAQGGQLVVNESTLDVICCPEFIVMCRRACTRILGAEPVLTMLKETGTVMAIAPKEDM